MWQLRTHAEISLLKRMKSMVLVKRVIFVFFAFLCVLTVIPISKIIPRAELRNFSLLVRRSWIVSNNLVAPSWETGAQPTHRLPIHQHTLITNDNKQNDGNTSKTSHFPFRIWMSSSVCWSENTNLHGKSNYPYRLAIKLSSKLWRERAGVSVIIQVIYNSQDAANDTLKSYVEDLRKDGHVVYAVESGETACSLRAQMQRMLPYTINEVQDDDLVITTDADAFLLDPELLRPFQNGQYKIWLLLYSETLTNGTTFSMSFIGMRNALWRDLLESAANPKELLEKFRTKPLKHSMEGWFEDQRILSQAILESRICTAPANNSIWTKVGLAPSGLNETQTPDCFYGYNLEYCNIYRQNIKGGCKWWHGHPQDDSLKVQRIYDESSRTGTLSWIFNR